MAQRSPRGSRRVRLYTLTGGRTRGHADLPLETQVMATGITPTMTLTPEQAVMLATCREPAGLVDLSAALKIPLGVVRVLLGDLLVTGLVTSHSPLTAAVPVHRDVALLEEVLDGIEAL